MVNNPCALLATLVVEPDEAEWLEFKQNTFDPKKIGCSSSALSNSAMLLGKDRAYIVFGIENGTHKRVGTTVRLKREKVKGENFEQWLSRRLQPTLTVGMYDFECEGLRFAIIELEPSYSAPVRFDGVEYIRIGENTRRLDEYPDRRRALWLKTSSRSFEHAIALPNVGADEVFLVLDVPAFFSLQPIPMPLQRAEQLRDHEDLLRETIANALVHQDFTISGSGPMIEIFSNRVEISNPGQSLIQRDRLLNDKRSRNVEMAKAMRDFHLCEERGSGLDKAFRAAENTGLPAPDPVISETSTQMTLLAPTAFDEMTRAQKLHSLYYHCALKYADREYMTNASLRERFGLPGGKSKMQAITDLITRAKKDGKIVPADPEQVKKGARYIPYWAGKA